MPRTKTNDPKDALFLNYMLNVHSSCVIKNVILWCSRIGYSSRRGWFSTPAVGWVTYAVAGVDIWRTDVVLKVLLNSSPVSAPYIAYLNSLFGLKPSTGSVFGP